jgi:hypothetical protein
MYCKAQTGNFRFKVKTKRPPLVQLHQDSLDNSPVFRAKDDTFDKLFDRVDVKKMAPPPASCISASDRSSDLTNQSHSHLSDHVGLFQSFSQEKNVGKVEGPRPKKKSNRRLKSRIEMEREPTAAHSQLSNTLDVQIKYDKKVKK